MILEPQDQLKKFLDNSKEVLLLIPQNPSADAVGSAWALYYFLEKKKIKPTIAFANHLSKKFEFLPRPEQIINDISGARDFVLSFDISKNKIIKLRSEEQDNKFNIYLTPERGSIDPRDFSFILAKFKYDLLITIDTPDLEGLGKLYNSNTDLFFEVPLVNIDCRSNNENFGQINLVDVTASSSAEIVGKILEEIDSSSIDENIATCILTGIIGATDSFQKKNTTPKSLLIAAGLMDKGADQQKIIRWLYKTQPLHILKLWGRAMAKLQWDPEINLVWSVLTLDDFVQSRASIQDVSMILEKFQENYSEGKIFMAVYNDTPNSSLIVVETQDPEVLKKIHQTLGGEEKKHLLEFKIDRNEISAVGKAMAEKIKQTISNPR